jgi:hypothetical protein
MLRGPEDEPDRAADDVSFMAELSPWLSERLTAKLQPGSPGITDTGRAALRQALGAFSAPAPEGSRNRPAPPLIALMAGRLRPKGRRS